MDPHYLYADNDPEIFLYVDPDLDPCANKDPDPSLKIKKKLKYLRVLLLMI